MATAFKNVADNAASTTATVLSAPGVVSITIATGDGAKFSLPPFFVTLWTGNDPSVDANMEKVTCTAKTGDVFTISATTKTHAGTVNVGNLEVAQQFTDVHVAINTIENATNNSSTVSNETPVGAINGVNTAFTTAAIFATGSLRVSLNGQRLAPGSGVDYVEGSQAFTMQYAPATGDLLQVDYEITNISRFMQGTNSAIVQETPTGLVNSANASFTTLQNKYVPNSLEIFINGLQQIKATDYTETTPSTGVFTFVAAPITGDILKISYQFATGASGNADTVDGFHASSTPTANNLLPLDANAKQSLLTLTNPCKFSAYRSSAATYNGVPIVFDTKEFDTGGNFNASNGRFTAPVTGFYHLSAMVTYSITAAPQDPQFYMRKNGGGSFANPHFVNMYNGATYAAVTASKIVSLAAGDYVEVYGISLAISAAPDLSYFCGFLVSTT